MIVYNICMKMMSCKRDNTMRIYSRALQLQDCNCACMAALVQGCWLRKENQNPKPQVNYDSKFDSSAIQLRWLGLYRAS